MTRQEAYIAELSQLLFYMTPWDKAEVLKGITAMINHPETGVETMEEMGTPMKLAVTLHRQYTPTPEPTPEELEAKAAAEAAALEQAEEELNEETEEAEEAELITAIEEALAVEAEAVEEASAAEESAAEEEVPAEEPAAEEEAPVEEPAAEEEAPAEEPAAEEEAPAEEPAAEEEAPAEEAAAEEEAPAEEPAAEEEAPAEEPAAEEEAPAEEPAAEEKVPAEEPAAEEEVPAEEPAAEEEVPAEEPAAEEEAPAEEPAVEEETPILMSLKYEDKIGQEKIFAEIFNAATEAQSAVPLEENVGKTVERKARYLFLIPYIALAVIVGVPITLIFAVANVAVFATALLSLCGVVYLVIFWFMSTAVLSGQLIIIGLTLLMLAVTILLSFMTIWFLRTATVGFPRFLIEIAKTHGYREVEVQ